jgi:oligoendopeptidase F
MSGVSTSADGVHWNLSELCTGADEARAQWSGLVERATGFAERYRGRIAALDAAGLRELLDECDLIAEDMSRLYVYGSSRVNMDAADVEANDLATFARDRGAELENQLVFVELEWIALDDGPAEALLSSPELAGYAHRLRTLREEKPYVLSEAEEQAINARDPAVSSWSALHDRQIATLEIPFDAGEGVEPHSVNVLLSYMYRPERELRRGALAALYDGLAPRTEVLAACYDALVGDRLGLDRVRGFADPMQPTNMRNELDAETVDAMIAATRESYPLGRRWFEVKARLLGLDRLELADQYAPVGEGRDFAWAEAVEIVDSAFAGFSPRLAEIFRACLEAGHVDAAPRAGKASGAYCTTVSKRTLPFVLLNFTGRFRDVATLAHEFGHATHGALSLERQTYRSHRTGIAMAEVPSTFAQLIADDYQLQLEPDPQTRQALVVDRLEQAMAAIFRQVVLARFEQRAYALRAEGRTLTPERLSELWLEENVEYYGDAVALPDAYRLGWSYVPHFIHVRFYTYAYSFAYLVALLLYGRYHEDREAFVPRYLDFLASGGSASPHAQLEPFGLDLRAADTWRSAYAQFAVLLENAEELAA